MKIFSMQTLPSSQSIHICKQASDFMEISMWTNKRWRKKKFFSDPFWLLASNTAYFLSIFQFIQMVCFHAVFQFQHSLLHLQYFLFEKWIDICVALWFFFLFFFFGPILKATISTITSVCIIGFWVFRCHFFSHSVTLLLFFFLPLFTNEMNSDWVCRTQNMVLC